jgi:hypothetical protein
VRNEKACRATRWLAVGGRARQRVGERVKRQVGAQQGAEERLVYGWLINQKSLISVVTGEWLRICNRQDEIRVFP